MKKIVLITVLMCFIGTFTACGNENPQVAGVSEIIEESTPEKEPEEIKEPENVELPQILSLMQTYVSRHEWQNDIWIMCSEYSNVTMQEDTQTYPKLERTFLEIANMQARTMDDEADNILSFVQEISDINSENFETQTSVMNVQVRRADNVVVSLLTDSYSDYGFIDDFRALWGSNYDVSTGEELMLSDVVLDMEALPEIVLKELNSHIWAGDLFSEKVVEDYFNNTPIDSVSWTLDYNGVTFYFGNGDLEEMGNAGRSATVSFAEYPQLFNKKYMNIPKAYMVRLPLDQSFFTDLDGDGTLEELNCSGVYNKEERFYTQFGIYSDLDGHYHYEELFAYDFHPYYVKTEDDNHYIYLFCEGSEGGNRQMMLAVYNVNGGVITRGNDMNVAPAYIPSDTFVLPLDPNNMLLDNYDNNAQDAEFYMVGKDGMPVKK